MRLDVCEKITQFKTTCTATTTNNNHDNMNKIKFMFWEGVSFDWNTDNQLGTPFREHFSRMEKVREIMSYIYLKYGILYTV